jgi:hypothetical protein
MHFNFTITVLRGDISKNNLTCTISDFPFGTDVTPQSMQVGQLLGGVYEFNIGNVTPGDYPIKFTISAPNANDEVHILILRIQPPVDYSNKLAGTYNQSYDFCQPGGLFNYASVVTDVQDSAYRITISNIKNLGPSVVVRAILSDRITIPVQTAGAYTIWGSGNFSKDGRAGHENDYTLLINDTLVSGIDTQRCTIHIEH